MSISLNVFRPENVTGLPLASNKTEERKMESLGPLIKKLLTH